MEHSTSSAWRVLGNPTNFPRCIEFQTNNSCNARCTPCPYPETTALEKKGRMSGELIEKILEECAENAHQMDLLIPYLNNEPFTDVRMLNVLRRIKHEIGIAVELSTNGSLLDAETARALVQEDLVSVLRVSFFGGDKVRYERRMHRLSWEAACTNVQALVDAARGNRIRVEIVVVATADLEAWEVEQLSKRWQDDNTSVRVFGYLDRAGNNHSRNVLPVFNHSARLAGCDLNRPFERMAIRWNGDCVLCSQDWRGQVVLGNVRDHTIKEIWFGKTAQAIRDMVLGRLPADRDFLCRSCKLAIFE